MRFPLTNLVPSERSRRELRLERAVIEMGRNLLTEHNDMCSILLVNENAENSSHQYFKVMVASLSREKHANGLIDSRRRVAQ